MTTKAPQQIAREPRPAPAASATRSQTLRTAPPQARPDRRHTSGSPGVVKRVTSGPPTGEGGTEYQVVLVGGTIVLEAYVGCPGVLFAPEGGKLFGKGRSPTQSWRHLQPAGAQRGSQGLDELALGYPHRDPPALYGVRLGFAGGDDRHRVEGEAALQEHVGDGGAHPRLVDA